MQCEPHHDLQTSCARTRCEHAYGICEALFSRTGDETKIKSVTNLEGCKFAVHVVMLRAQTQCYSVLLDSCHTAGSSALRRPVETAAVLYGPGFSDHLVKRDNALGGVSWQEGNDIARSLRDKH
jgi:hypothetical protein